MIVLYTLPFIILIRYIHCTHEESVSDEAGGGGALCICAKMYTWCIVYLCGGVLCTCAFCACGALCVCAFIYIWFLMYMCGFALCICAITWMWRIMGWLWSVGSIKL